MFQFRPVAEALQEAFAIDRARQHTEIFFGPGGPGRAIFTALEAAASTALSRLLG